jgi:hypothetical protein
LEIDFELLTTTAVKTKESKSTNQASVITEELMDTGMKFASRYIGFGQWRSGGFGRFEVAKIDQLTLPVMASRVDDVGFGSRIGGIFTPTPTPEPAPAPVPVKTQ